ncbi:MAG: hypothetical protein AAF658_06960 [Myxococcota bacterium]
MDRFIPPEDRVSTPAQLIRSQFLVVLSFLTSVSSFFIAGLVLAFQRELAPSFPFIIVLGFVTGALPFLYRRFRRAELWAVLVLISTKIPVTLVTVFSGGFFSAALVFNVLFPFAASTLLYVRAGLVVAVLIIVEIQVFYLIYALGIPLPTYDSSTEIWFQSITLSIVTFILLLMALSVEVMRDNATRMQSRLARELVIAQRLADLGELSGEIAHELNNPLSYTIANLEQLTHDLESNRLDEAVLSESIRDALSGALSVNDKVQILLQKVQAERSRIDSADLASVIDRAVETAAAFGDDTVRPRVIRPKALPRVRGHGTSLDPIFHSVVLESLKQLDGDLVVVLEEDGPWVSATFRREASRKRVHLDDSPWIEFQAFLDGVGGELALDRRGGEITIRLPRA